MTKTKRQLQDDVDRLERECAELRGRVAAFEFVERLRTAPPTITPLPVAPHVPGTILPTHPSSTGQPPAYPGYPHVTCAGNLPTVVVTVAKTTLDATACAGALGPGGFDGHWVWNTPFGGIPMGSS